MNLTESRSPTDAVFGLSVCPIVTAIFKFYWSFKDYFSLRLLRPSAFPGDKASVLLSMALVLSVSSYNLRYVDLSYESEREAVSSGSATPIYR